MKFNKTFPFLIMVVIPIIFALTLPFFFKLDVFTDPQQIASIIAMILLPFSEGMLLIATSSFKRTIKTPYRIFMPWMAILVFFLFTFLFHLEDCACWIIGLPLYLLLSSLGGLIAGYFKLKKQFNPIPEA